MSKVQIKTYTKASYCTTPVLPYYAEVKKKYCLTSLEGSWWNMDEVVMFVIVITVEGETVLCPDQLSGQLCQTIGGS